MKITKGKLQQIIREELTRVLSEHSDWHDDEHETLADRKYADRSAPEQSQEMYVVRVTSSSPHSGARTSYWPSNDEPFVGSREAANLEVGKATEGPVPGKRSRFTRDWRVVALDLDRMKSDDPMRAPLMAAAENAQSFGDLHPDDEPMHPNFQAFKDLEDDDDPDANDDGALDGDELRALANKLD